MTINALLEYSDIDRFNVFSKRVQSTIDSQTGTINRAASLSLPRYLCIIQHQQWREVYQTSPSVFVSRLSSFFCQKVRLFSLKRCHCCLHLLIFFSVWSFRTIMKLILLWIWIFMCIRSDFREPDPVVIVNLPVIENKVWMRSPNDRQKNVLTRQQYYRWYFVVVVIIIIIIIFNFLTREVGPGGWRDNEKNWDAQIKHAFYLQSQT